jgi:N-acetylglucosaminyl-diphospho-decaprenol L-rhamnosyltransferase
MADVRVGIVSWNTADWLERCLSALPDALGGLEAEVVVVDNASSDGSADRAATFRWADVRQGVENVGYGRAMNVALSGTEAPALLALNPDTEPPPGSLESLVRLLDQHPGAGIVAPRLTRPDGEVQHSVYRFPSLRLAAVANLLPRFAQQGARGERWCLETSASQVQQGEVDWVIGAVHCIRRAALQDEAPYRELWFMYVEDLDLCWRLHERGWSTVYAPEVTVVHAGNAAGDQAWGRERTGRWLEATYDWYRRERGPGAARAYAGLNLAGAGSKAVGLGAASLLGGPRKPERRYWARELASVVPVHLAALLR